MANYLKGIGDVKTGKNEILPSFDAKILRYITQNAAGVSWTEANKFALTVIDRGIQVGAGMVQAFGYFGMSDSPTQLTFVYPAGSAQYSRIYAEINLSVTPHQFEIKATSQSTTSNIPLLQDDLSAMPSGVYQVPLYLLTINSNNTITYTDQRVNNTKPEHAKNAENAAQATNSTHANNLATGGTIASNVTATTQAQSDNTTKVATTAYVRAAVEAIKNITQGSISIQFAHTSVAANWVRRQVNFVVGFLDVSQSNPQAISGTSHVVATIPTGFRPSSDFACYIINDNWTFSGAPRSHDCTIKTNGQVVMNSNVMGGNGMQAMRSYRLRLKFGYEI